MKKKLSIAIAFIVGTLFAGFITYNAIREVYRNRSIEKEVADLKQQAQQIKQENDELSQRIAYFQTPEFQEKIAKEKLNMQKPDENVVVVKVGDVTESQTQSSASETVQGDRSDPNYLKWWNYFFKYTP